MVEGQRDHFWLLIAREPRPTVGSLPAMEKAPTPVWQPGAVQRG